MADFDVSTMTLDELEVLRKDIDRALETYEKRKRKEALAAAEATVAEFGYNLSDLVRTKKPKGKKKSGRHKK